ncbi:MAG TPA: ABC transporter permease [Gemmatimonadaceae bacterium]
MRLLAWLVPLLVVTAVGRFAAPRLTAPSASGGPWRSTFARVVEDRVAMTALCVIITLYVVAALAPWLAPYSPVAQPDIVALKGQPPSLAHLFGTDQYSRDVFSRVLYGARVSLSVALLAVLVSATIGTAYGAIAGYYGGRVDGILMRLIDAALAIPRLLLLITVLALWGALPIPYLVLVLGLTGWFGVSRIVRTQVLSVKQREMVLAARALGASDRRILWRHVLPNVLSPVIVAATIGLGNVIVLEAGLSYLGIGVQQPLASWGNIIQDGADQLTTLWWISLFPGLAIVLTVVAFNLVGDGLRDALDPKRLRAESRK